MSEPVCSLPTPQPEAEVLLEGVRTIAVVGLSPQPERDSHRVAKYLQEQGYRIIPIRPGVAEILGERAYPSLSAYGQPVDVVDVFRRSEAVPGIVEEAIRLGCKIIWLQEGVGSAPAVDRALAAGLKVVENRCLEKVHRAWRRRQAGG